MFSWDARKAISNHEKHGVSFEEAATIFDDPSALDWKDAAHSVGEVRRKRLGRSMAGRIVIAIYTVRRTAHGNETIRIISARQSNRRERQAYAGQGD